MVKPPNNGKHYSTILEPEPKKNNNPTVSLGLSGALVFALQWFHESEKPSGPRDTAPLRVPFFNTPTRNMVLDLC
jgi:hypothetical protein